MFQIILPNNINLAVASYGGVGTTFLMEFLSKYKNINNPYDRDGFKHLPIPPLSFNRSLKFIYIYGKPQDAASSLFRRQMHRSQSMKLQSFIASKKIFIPKEMTLQEYASEGKDRFHFQEHFFNWYEHYLPANPVLFIKYEALYENIQNLFSFCGIPEKELSNFPKKRERTRDKSISAETMPSSMKCMVNLATGLKSLKTLSFDKVKFGKYLP